MPDLWQSGGDRGPRALPRWHCGGAARMAVGAGEDGAYQALVLVYRGVLAESAGVAALWRSRAVVSRASVPTERKGRGAGRHARSSVIGRREVGPSRGRACPARCHFVALGAVGAVGAWGEMEVG